VIAGLLRRLSGRRPADGHPFGSLQQICDEWAESVEIGLELGGAAADPGLARAGADMLRGLARTAGRSVLLCTDLHAENVLSSEREPWLGIDPKPFIGDPAFDPVQHILNCDRRLASDPIVDRIERQCRSPIKTSADIKQKALISESSVLSRRMQAALLDAPFRLPATPEESDLLSKYFRVLGDRNRLRILDLVADHERSVGELAALLGQSQPKVSNHLACLRWCGFVATRREHRTVHYRLADARVGAMIALGRELLRDNAEHVAACRRADAPGC
jgi:DNA-binding transcriptional ArsR family regulator